MGNSHSFIGRCLFNIINIMRLHTLACSLVLICLIFRSEVSCDERFEINIKKEDEQDFQAFSGEKIELYFNYDTPFDDSINYYDDYFKSCSIIGSSNYTTDSYIVRPISWDWAIYTSSITLNAVRERIQIICEDVKLYILIKPSTPFAFLN